DGRTTIVVENYSQLLDTPAMVYNLEVADGHTYFVEDGQGAQTAIWVHNKCKLETQIHHIATKYGDYGKEFSKLFKKAGRTLEYAKNKIAVPRHMGRHTNAYHKAVHKYLTHRLAGKTGEEAREVLDSALTYLRKKLIKNPGWPYEP
ncbi:MAG: polymorphic toxin-type HINT domain-containing protein, partial [Planctomycetia bacterium]|nr:polymorphic toxin-type HINT domain-containing protein [Planctomycetia bacterium]